MVQYNVDDPFCQYTSDENGTVINITYTGHISTWDTPQAACTGVNLRAANIGLVLTGIFITTTAVVFCYRFLLSRRKTTYNYLMFICPIVCLMGLLLDLITVANFSQYNGHPNIGHLPKVFYYSSCTLIGLAQGVRVEFLLIGWGRSRVWAPRFVKTLLIIGAVFAVWAIVSFAIGASLGIEKAGMKYILPYSFWFVTVGATDVVLSAMILHLCYRQTALLRSYDTLTISEVQAFAAQAKVAAAIQLIGDLTLAIIFNLSSGGSGGLGYTYSYASTMSLPFQYSFLLYSIYLLQKVQQLKNAGPRTGTGSGSVTSGGSHSVNHNSSVTHSTRGLTSGGTCTDAMERSGKGLSRAPTMRDTRSLREPGPKNV
ncbi:hypothetical protein SpCBS45565_g07177 [Spizellomyces sp. 'palustris']|nr:hypothetical protein SpCBS45565_g07177 [Spizellomyces sp. 'palustris']